MASWCSSNDVKVRVRGNPSDELAQEYADEATSLLYEMTGRRFTTESNVNVTYQINGNGYVKLTAWVPVRAITSATVNGVAVIPVLSPGGTYAIFDLSLAYQIAAMTIAVGQDPPIAGKIAAAALAAAMLRSDVRYQSTGVGGAAPSDVLANPRPTSITRQGVTYTYTDPVTLAEKQLTGVDEADKFLRAANPNGMRYQPKVVTAT
jgi:hypothetical protein